MVAKLTRLLPSVKSRAVYDAWQRAAEIYEVWDQSDRAKSCVPKPTISTNGSMITLARQKAFTVWDWIVTSSKSSQLPQTLVTYSGLGLYLQNGRSGWFSDFPTRSVVAGVYVPSQPRIQLITRSVINSAVFGPMTILYCSWTEGTLSPQANRVAEGICCRQLL